MRYTQKTEHYLSIKKNEMLPSATTRMDLEGRMLNKIELMCGASLIAQSVKNSPAMKKTPV